MHGVRRADFVVNSNYRQCNSNYRKILNIKIAGQLLAIAVQNDTCLHGWCPQGGLCCGQELSGMDQEWSGKLFLKNSCILLGIPD